MTLDKAIEYIIDKEGLEMLSQPRLCNYLADLQVVENSVFRRIVLAMIEGGYMNRLIISLSYEDYELQFNKVGKHLVQDEGFQENYVKYVLACILFATHKIKEKPLLPKQSRFQDPIESKKKHTTQIDIKMSRQNDEYIVELDKQTYKLNESQYKALMRKKDMPIDRLSVWLTSYEEENRHSESNMV